ncbi:ATP-dependent helicase BRM-like isoform X2 [Bidens hawaiensis]|uniref:ATP-dependent helicase BRM-like isoform X2 n=1 Tax=Bidens hawaiensis TaxID=980011 RepID=UPI00404B5C88
MQSGGGGPPSASASPSSSSAPAVSRFDPVKHQQQQQQMQLLQQQLLRNPEGREAMLAYQAGIRQGVSGLGSGSMQQMQQQHGQDEGQNTRHGFDQHMSPMQQAYMQYAQQAQQAQQKSSPGMQVQQAVSSQSQNQIQKHFGIPASFGQMIPGSNMGQMQVSQGQQGINNMGNSQVAMAAQMQAMQALALERNIDLSRPENVNLMAQIMPIMQSRMFGQQKVNESNTGPHSPQVANASSPHSDVSGHSGSTKARQAMSPGHPGSTQNTPLVNTSSGGQGQQFPIQGRENQMAPRQSMPPPQSLANMSQNSDHFSKNMVTGPESLQIQHARQQIDNPLTSQKVQKLPPGFTKQQFHVLKAQILAFRRIKKGEKTLPRELLQAIAPPPLEVQLQQITAPAGRNLMDSNNKDLQAVMNFPKREVHKEKETAGSTANAQSTTVINETPSVSLPAKEELRNPSLPTKQEHEVEHVIPKTSHVAEGSTDKGKAVVSQSGDPTQTKDPGPSRKYHGPLFDFPFFTRKHDSFGSSMMLNNNNNLTLAYDVKDLVIDEGIDMINKKKNESLKKINSLLAVNLERKRIRPDLVIKLQIEEKKLLLQDVQARVREEVDQQQQHIMAMPDRPYRKFIRLCERQRLDLNRQVQAAQRIIRKNQLKSLFQWRKKLLESHWAIRDARTSRNMGVAKYHEKMLREFWNEDDDISKRMEALKNNDVERYREILLEQQNNVPSEAAERYEVLSSFLSQTEDYLNKLGGKLTAAKNQQEAEEATNAAAAVARAQGLSEEEVRAAASRAREEVLIRNRFTEMNAPQDSSSVSKYYTLAHAVSERVTRQPSMLRKGTLRDYQLVGLQWMLSLYNNKLNGILADEMGLGKTVQVMALIAYLMEYKSNYGPHLIIVPNAVLVNWKSELRTWLPNASCIYYVGNKDQRTKLFTQEVRRQKFNVLVTTYEFIMFDKSKLSRVDWKYIVIDEAQRMKDRDSVLARDLDKYRCQRRLLLTGTPLQNDLKELWSLLNLLLPDVFDNRKVFHEWFSQPFQKDGAHNAEDDWLETEKKVIIIHRLHQILEPFMLRRRVEDVEGSLPPKISIILRCKMSAIQGVIYDWIKATGTIRVDPEDEKRKVQKSSIYQAKTFKPLKNKIVELRKTCNHPLLTYPFFNDLSKEFLVKSCGKLWVLDRILVKLQRTGHRVLLFSTMTKLLDILEEYLQWRRLVYRRIDGTTSLEDRESAIVDFNSPDTDCFVFLLSIRAAGRGLNLQTADTVIIYDPDANPQNEEQAVARAHRIGQTREVKVIYMEAVVDQVSSHQKEDNLRNGGSVDSDDDLAGKDRYVGSIESLIRNNIQQYKIEMADEVINAGRFDQRTTHEERRSTLESLLRDEERYQETVHDVPSLQKVNRMIARSEEEVEIFDQMDEEFDWTDEMTQYDQVPKWLRAGTREVNSTIARMSKKPLKNTLFTDNIGVESSEMGSDVRRARLKGKKFLNYAELDDTDLYEASSEEIADAAAAAAEEEQEQEQEAADSDNDDDDDDDDDDETAPVVDQSQSEEDDIIPASRQNNMLQEPGSSGSSSDSKRSTPMTIPSISSKKFGSLSALVVQPKLKRKRSIRVRPQPAVTRQDNKSIDRSSLLRGPSSHLPFQADRKLVKENNAYKNEQSSSSVKAKQTPPARKISGQPTRTNPISGPSENSNVKKGSGSFGGTMMTEAIQRRCKNVITKIQRRIDKEGQQIIPLLTDLWKRTESPRGGSGNSLDLRKIELRVDRLEYNGVTDLIVDVQLMLKTGMQFFGFSHEVRSEARKVHDLFFDIMKIAFPDTDFREARSALTFSGPMASSSPKGLQPIGQTKRTKQTNNPEPEPRHPSRPLSRWSIPARETRFGNTSSGGAGSSHGLEESKPLSHPGDLVTCKKKRKDRAGPVSPVRRGIRSPGQSRPSQSQTVGQQGSGGGASVGWANPVKKMRTDVGRRRPNQQ